MLLLLNLNCLQRRKSQRSEEGNGVWKGGARGVHESIQNVVMIYGRPIVRDSTYEKVSQKGICEVTVDDLLISILLAQPTNPQPYLTMTVSSRLPP